jgi:hypothetical protein
MLWEEDYIMGALRGVVRTYRSWVTFLGITNSGSHWIEPATCEKCNITGHMEGQLSGSIYYKNNQRLDCHLVCSYALYFKPSKEFEMDGLKGTVEGVLGSECYMSN